MEDSEEISGIYGGKRIPSILGSQGFIQSVKERFFSQKRHREIPESKALAPDAERIRAAVCRAYGVEHDELLRSQRGAFNEPRNVAIFRTRQLRGNRLVEVCRTFNLSRYSSASSAIERLRIQMERDRALRRRVEQITNELMKRQT